jgi:hypothetical protein
MVSAKVQLSKISLKFLMYESGVAALMGVLPAPPRRRHTPPLSFLRGTMSDVPFVQSPANLSLKSGRKGNFSKNINIVELTFNQG